MDGIVSRSPKEVNYSTLNRKKSKAITWIEQELKMKYRKCKIFSNLVKIGNKAKKTSKTKILNQPGNKNKIKKMKLRKNMMEKRTT